MMRITEPSFNNSHRERERQVPILHWICPWSLERAMENPRGFQGLKARSVLTERRAAAFCSRPKRVTVVIGVSLDTGKAN
jgi:hypothetical protein